MSGKGAVGGCDGKLGSYRSLFCGKSSARPQVHYLGVSGEITYMCAGTGLEVDLVHTAVGIRAVSNNHSMILGVDHSAADILMRNTCCTYNLHVARKLIDLAQIEVRVDTVELTGFITCQINHRISIGDALDGSNLKSAVIGSTPGT